MTTKKERNVGKNATRICNPAATYVKIWEKGRTKNTASKLVRMFFLIVSYYNSSNALLE